MIPVDRPLPLPRTKTAEGDPRHIGVEIELGGLDEAEVARIVAETCGGTPHQTATFDWLVEGGPLGDVEVYLDTSFRKDGGTLVETAIETARGVLPVEIVTAPVAPDEIATLDTLCAALRDAGARGSRDGVLLGFGVHFNPQVVSTELDDILPTLRAFALLEDTLRAMDPIDPSRRAQPFVDRWPKTLVDALAEGDFADLAALIDCYLENAPSRNYDLDALPLFMEIDAEKVEAAEHGLGGVSARPTWHYRMPDCRVDEPQWSLAYEWNRWVLVEEVARDSALLESLAAEWARHRDEGLLSRRSDWAERAGAMVAEAGLMPSQTRDNAA
ncbi:hypothetical protein DYI42_10060 [Vannielia litorea]|nr:hypothetical protein [Vannielia litorea]